MFGHFLSGEYNVVQVKRHRLRSFCSNMRRTFFFPSFFNDRINPERINAKIQSFQKKDSVFRRDFCHTETISLYFFIALEYIALTSDKIPGVIPPENKMLKEM